MEAPQSGNLESVAHPDHEQELQPETEPGLLSKPQTKIIKLSKQASSFQAIANERQWPFEATFGYGGVAQASNVFRDDLAPQYMTSWDRAPLISQKEQLLLDIERNN